MTTPDFRNLPSVDKVLDEPAIVGLLSDGYLRDLIVATVRERIAEARDAVAGGAQPPTAAAVAQAVADGIQRTATAWPTPVLNATGVILHTNLGRAPLSTESLHAVAAAAQGYADLEINLLDGKRGSRYAAVAQLLRQLTGAEDAIAVNNNAGAILLGLASTTAGSRRSSSHAARRARSAEASAYRTSSLRAAPRSSR